MKILKFVGIALVGALLLAFGMSIFGGGLDFENPFAKEVNDKNLIKVDNYFENYEIKETEKGMKINWNDDGSFALYGKHEDKELAESSVVCYEFTEVLLTPGTYTLDAGNKKADVETFGIYAKVGEDIYYVDAEKDGSVSFTVEDTRNVVIGWFIKNDYRIIYQKIEPTLVQGESSIEFYK